MKDLPAVDPNTATMTGSDILPRRSVSLATTYLLLVAVLLPFARPYLPGNSVLLDWANVVVLPLLWIHILVERKPIRIPLFWPMFLLLGAGMLPLLGQPDAGLSLTILFKEMYLYLWFLSMVNFTGYKLPKQLLTVFVMVAIAIAILAIMQWVSPEIQRATTSFGAEVKGGRYAQGATRPLGLFRNPTMLGNYLVLALFLLVGSPLWKRARLRWIVAICLLGGIVASGSFGSMAGLIAGVSIVCWLRRRYLLTRAVFVRLTAAVLILGIVILAVGDAFLQTSVGVRASDRFNTARLARSYQSRMGIWKPAVESLAANPLGTGVGLLVVEEMERFRGTHNDYLAALIERGILGGVAMVWLLISVWLLIPPSGLRWSEYLPVSGLYRTALLGALTAMAVSSLSVNLFRFRHLWFLLFLVAQARFSARFFSSQLTSAKRESGGYLESVPKSTS